MATQIFVNLPVKDLSKSKAFFAKLGFTFNPQFTDEKAACMIIAENIFAMLLVEPFSNHLPGRKLSMPMPITMALATHLHLVLIHLSMYNSPLPFQHHS